MDIATQFFTNNIPDLTPDLLTANRARAPLTAAHAYYRPKTLVIENHLNPLTAAAAGLLALAAHLPAVTTPLATLFDDLCHEIRAFESRAQAKGYHSHIILAARYALCAFMDELTAPLYQGFNDRLLATFHSDDWGGEKFYTIMERALEDAKLHIDLLELLYICLKLGFKGRHKDDNNQYEVATATLYSAIRHQRQPVSGNFHLIATEGKIIHGETQKIWQICGTLLLYLSILLPIILFIALIIGNHKLNKLIEPIEQQLQQFTLVNTDTK